LHFVHGLLACVWRLGGCLSAVNLANNVAILSLKQ